MKLNPKPRPGDIRTENWKPGVFDDTAPIETRFEQIREFALTLSEAIYENAEDIQALRPIEPAIDTKKPEPAIANHSDASPGKSAGNYPSREISDNDTFSIPRPTKLT